MNLRVLFLIPVFFFYFLLSPSVYGEDPQASQVQQIFSQYNQYLMARQGKEAMQYISHSSIQHYGRMLDLALRGSKKEVKRMPLSDQINILTARHLIDLNELKTMNGPSFFIYVVDHEWVPKEAIAVQSLGRIKVKGNQAIAPVLIEGKNVGLKMRFINELGGWKVDLTSIIKKSSQGLEFAAFKIGKSQNQFIIMAVEKAVGRNLDGKLWTPPL